MALNFCRISCPVCEGTGWEVDTFNPPPPWFNSLEPWRRPHIDVLLRSDGHKFNEHGVCDYCQGRRGVMAVLLPSGTAIPMSNPLPDGKVARRCIGCREVFLCREHEPPALCHGCVGPQQPREGI